MWGKYFENCEWKYDKFPVIDKHLRILMKIRKFWVLESQVEMKLKHMCSPRVRSLNTRNFAVVKFYDINDGETRNEKLLLLER